MAATIAPVVHGGKRIRYWSTVALHSLAATIGAGALGAALGGLGAALQAPWGAASAITVAIVAAVYALRELVGLRVPIPDRHRQVPEWWRAFFSTPVAALLYGLGLGVGFLTFLTFGTFVAVAAGALASGSVLLGVAICAPFGLARGLSVTIARRADTSERAAAVGAALEDLAATAVPRRVNGVVLASVVTVAVLAGP